MQDQYYEDEEQGEEDYFHPPGVRVGGEGGSHQVNFSEKHCQHFQNHQIKCFREIIAFGEHLKESQTESDKKKAIHQKIQCVGLEDPDKHADVLAPVRVVSNFREKLQIH